MSNYILRLKKKRIIVFRSGYLLLDLRYTSEKYNFILKQCTFAYFCELITCIEHICVSLYISSFAFYIAFSNPYSSSIRKEYIFDTTWFPTLVLFNS